MDDDRMRKDEEMGRGDDEVMGQDTGETEEFEEVEDLDDAEDADVEER
jgi:hypothetical protein